jgi:hypothetical protein
MEQIQKQHIPRQRKPEVIEDLPVRVDEEALNVATEKVLGKIAVAIA